MIENRNVLITGGSGFIGSVLAGRLAVKNEVVLFDRDFRRLPAELKNNPNVSLIEANILDEKAVAGAVSGAQVIIHTAAVLGVRNVIRDSLQTIEVNYNGTSNLLRQAAESPACKRFLFLSTSEAFGINADNISENGDAVFSPVDDPRWCYALSKLAAEHLCFAYYRQKQLPVTVIRPFNIFGAGRTGDYVVLRFIVRALHDQDIEVYGDGSQVRAWCYIDDFAEGVLLAMEGRAATGQAFNIGNPGNTVTVLELARKIKTMCNSRSAIRLKELDFRDIETRTPDIDKARNVLGFVPRIDIDTGLEKTIKWARDNIAVLAEITGGRE